MRSQPFAQDDAWKPDEYPPNIRADAELELVQSPPSQTGFQEQDITQHARSNADTENDHRVGHDGEREELIERTPRLRQSVSIARPLSYVEEDEVQTPLPPARKDALVSWSHLPNKKQLAILVIARLSEPLAATSLQAYMFYQLKSFDPTLPDSSISFQAGMLQASFTAAQFLTAILWGRVADSAWSGRKRVLMMGTLGTSVASVGFGFSRTFLQAALYRTLGGAMNGNPGISRTMVSEIIKEKKFQSRAFLLLPMCANIGAIIGPILGGLLASPVENYPSIFGDNSIFGGEHGVWWMKHWPYALPNLVNATFLFAAAMGIFFGLEETLDSRRNKPDIGLRISQTTSTVIQQILHPTTHKYTRLTSHEAHDSPPNRATTGLSDLETAPLPLSTPPATKRTLPLRRLWTRNVFCTLLAYGLLNFHHSTFQNLWFIFLSTPRFNPAHPHPPSHRTQSFPFRFTGGLGMPPTAVGLAMSIIGTIGITLQLGLYPALSQRLGTIRSLRLSLLLFPLAYSLAPYLALVPTSSPPPAQASGIPLYAALTAVLFIQVLARTFALPATLILLNNASPHPSVLGTLHGVGQSVSSAMRTLGPVLGGWGLGAGLRAGVVGAVWWALAAVAVGGWLAGGLVYEGSGHEVILDGEDGKAGTTRRSEPERELVSSDAETGGLRARTRGLR